LIKGEEAKELSKHHGKMSTQIGINPIILEIRKGLRNWILFLIIYI
jgi:hypothetical protein